MERSSLPKYALLMILFSSLSLSLTGCFNRGSSEEVTFKGPIEGWSDIALPENAEWEKTLVSGQVENHSYTIAMDEMELWEFMEEAMAYNGWTISKAYADGREFVKNEDRVNMSINGEKEGKLNVFIIIEPKDAYMNKSEKTKDEKEEERN
ncbi:MAG: hypothetical protein ACD_28C00132G0008 [uncultured bacterium]|nr:MAG: hypothetical protein ACD_28C00132G0008 [uncultured bacterium]KKT72734.1 MAG: hypothetical protein UW70_C0101G0002 [Candidatus Peregrinibacteria bacterium GW2011_GWA2_44_7]